MPLCRLIKKAYDGDGKEVLLNHACVLLKEGNRWTILDPENNNELVRGASTRFLRNEIAANRLVVDSGWDRNAPEE